MICCRHRKKMFLWHRPPIANLPNKLSVYSAPSTSWNKSPFGTFPWCFLQMWHLYTFIIYKCGCGHRNVLSKRQVWMSIFYMINFKKKENSWTQGSWNFLIKYNPRFLFLLQVRSCVFISNFHHSPLPPLKGY